MHLQSVENCQSCEKLLREILPCRSLQKSKIYLYFQKVFDKSLHQNQIAKGEKEEF